MVRLNTYEEALSGVSAVAFPDRRKQEPGQVLPHILTWPPLLHQVAAGRWNNEPREGQQ